MKVRLVRRGKRGLWTAIVSLPGNREKSIALRTTDEREARRKAREIEAQYEAAGTVDNPTVAAWLAHWYRTDCLPRLRGTTLETYGRVVRQVSERLGQVRLRDLRPEQVRQMQEDLLARGGRGGRPLDPATVAQVRGILRTALRHAEREGILARNAAALTRTPRVPRREAAYLTEQQMRRLLDASPDSPWRAYAAVVLMTGMRRGEALGLRWDAVDFGCGTIHVSSQRVPNRGRVEERAPKTESGARDLPMPEPVAAILRAIQHQQLRASATLGADPPPWVWAHRRKGAWQGYTPHQATHGVKALYAAAGLPMPKRPIHAMRHTASTLMAAQGADARLRQAQLGHEDPRLTEAVYTHALPEERREAAERLARRVEGTGVPVHGSRAVPTDSQKEAGKR